MTSEKSITAAIQRYLKKIGGKVIKTHGTGFGQAGTPDLIGVLRGRSLALEVKRPGEDTTPLQKVELRKWAEAGAIAGRVESVQEVKDLIKEIADV